MQGMENVKLVEFWLIYSPFSQLSTRVLYRMRESAEMQTFLTSALGARSVSDSSNGYFNTGAKFLVAIGEYALEGKEGAKCDKMVEKEFLASVEKLTDCLSPQVCCSALDNHVGFIHLE
jgi:hypothetical protein